MTEDRLALFELIDQGANGDLVREMLANSRSGPSPISFCIAAMAQGAFFGLTLGLRDDHATIMRRSCAPASEVCWREDARGVVIEGYPGTRLAARASF
jgi:hypothetical protein